MASTSIISGGASTPRQSYRVDQGRTIWIRQGRSGSPEDVLLANFSARVIEEIHVEDGRGTQVYFRVEAVLDGEARVVCLSAAQFRDMRWVEEYLGAGAIVESGYGFRDHLRAAFLHFSGDRRITSEYRHVGWREIDGQAVYLTASGGIGADGARPDVHVVPPPALHHLILPCSESEEAARAAVLASLELRQLGPARLLHPLLATVRRSILGDADFSAALIGKSGEFKTAVAVVMQQHFGSGFNERQVPGSAESTANALEESLHQAKDMLFVIDDIAPQANSDAARAQHAAVVRVLRAVGNGQGRQRMNADATNRPERPPRALPLFTGEDFPQVHSARARAMILDVARGSIDAASLTRAQEDGAKGRLASATGAFVKWLAPRMVATRSGWEQRVRVLTSDLEISGTHRRSLRTAAELISATALFVEFALDVGAVSAEYASAYLAEARVGILEAVADQVDLQRDTDSADAFLTGVSAALLSGRAHVMPLAGAIPQPPQLFGWQYTGGDEPRPRGHLIGWIDGDAIFLDQSAAYAVVQSMHPAVAAVTPMTLAKRLFEAGKLVAVDAPRGGKRRFSFRKTVGNVRRPTLYLRTESVIGEAADEGDDAESGVLS